MSVQTEISKTLSHLSPKFVSEILAASATAEIPEREEVLIEGKVKQHSSSIEML